MGRQLLLGAVVQAAIYLQALVLFPTVIRHAGAQGYGEFVALVALLYLLYGLYASGVPYRCRRELASVTLTRFDPRVQVVGSRWPADRYLWGEQWRLAGKP